MAASAFAVASAVLGALLAAGCGATPSLAQPPAWTVERGQAHPLVGRVWSGQAGAFIEPAALVAELRGARFVLLGEKHDNPDHHRLQGWLVEALRPRAVAFEMLDEADAPALAALPEDTPEALAAAVGWAESGWPPFYEYRPVFAATLDAGAAVVAAHPARETLRAAVREGPAALPAARREALRLGPLPADLQADLVEEIRATHCGHAPAHALAPMAAAQTLKDAWMAEAMVTAEPPVVLIAGAGHARNDRGVPYWLARHGLSADVRTVALVEVRDEQPDPAAYGADRFDYLWFTPRLEDIDPCEKFREQLERMRHPAG